MNLALNGPESRAVIDPQGEGTFGAGSRTRWKESASVQTIVLSRSVTLHQAPSPRELALSVAKRLKEFLSFGTIFIERTFALRSSRPLRALKKARAGLVPTAQGTKNAVKLPKFYVLQPCVWFRYNSPRFSKAPLRGAPARAFLRARGGRGICNPCKSLRPSFVNYFSAHFTGGHFLIFGSFFTR